MTTHVTFGAVSGEMSEPEGAGKAGGLVVIQEWHGLNAQMKAKVDRFAKAGYLSLAPDLFHGQVATNDADAGALMGKLDWDAAVKEIGAAVAHLRAHPRCNGKVGVLGYCMGGALTFAASRFVDGVTCGVAYYGIPDVPVVEAPASVRSAPSGPPSRRRTTGPSPRRPRPSAPPSRRRAAPWTSTSTTRATPSCATATPPHFDPAASATAWPRTPSTSSPSTSPEDAPPAGRLAGAGMNRQGATPRGRGRHRDEDRGGGSAGRQDRPS